MRLGSAARYCAANGVLDALAQFGRPERVLDPAAAEKGTPRGADLPKVITSPPNPRHFDGIEGRRNSA